MKKVIRLTESDLVKIVKRVINESMSQNNFKVGQKFSQVHNRQYIMSIGYRGASSGMGAVNYNDFQFDNPKVVNVSNDGVTLQIPWGSYNPNDVWKNGQNETRLSNNFCMTIPYNLIQEVRSNQLMISMKNSSIKSYIDENCSKLKTVK
jgi:hypothetical protein